MLPRILIGLLSYLVVIMCITIHEFAHAKVAIKCGDNTPRLYGRDTLYPLAHIDLIGTVLLPLCAILFGVPVIGWAKPVPVNPYNFSNPKKDEILVALAGPLANLLLATVISLFLRTFYIYELRQLLVLLVQINIILAIFNLLPIPPLDGSRILINILPYRYQLSYRMIMPFSIFIVWFLLMTGILWSIMSPFVNFLSKLLLGE